MPVDQFPQGSLVHSTVLERRYQCDGQTCKLLSLATHYKTPRSIEHSANAINGSTKMRVGPTQSK
jgi:hypothetical protein